MSISHCALTGMPLEEPVISKKTGHIFEKKVILKQIEMTGQCPKTGQDLSIEDLVEVNVDKAAKPRTQTETSVPGLLGLVQSEWDGLMLEIHSLKENLHSSRQDLSQALYQYEAACRVICRLVKERDEAREKLSEYKEYLSSVQEKEPEPEEEEKEELHLPSELVVEFNKLSEELTSQRKGRKVPEGTANESRICHYRESDPYPLHISREDSKAGVTCFEFHSQDDTIALTGGRDNVARLISLATMDTLASFNCESKITDVKFLPSESINVITCSADNTADVYEIEVERNYKYSLLYPVRVHSGSVTMCSVHPHSEYCLFASKDGTWSFHNLTMKSHMRTVEAPDKVAMHSAMIHPDGLMVAGGLSNGHVVFWDIRSMEIVNQFEAHSGAVNRISFSERGYQMATVAKGDPNTLLWDLRKLGLQEPQKLFSPKNKIVNVATFDNYGSLLGVGGSIVELYNPRKGLKVGELITSEQVTEMKFAERNKMILIGSKEGYVRVLR